MNILIAGASGFIGRNLVKALQSEHNLTVLGRDSQLLQHYFPQNVKICTWEALPQIKASSYDALINLCGYNIAKGHWTNKIKHEIIDSRVKTSTELLNWAIRQDAKPHFYCANAVGIYGLQKTDDLSSFDEDSPIDFNQPHDFLSEIGIRWQQALKPALDHGIKVTITRFGVVLKKGEGILKKLIPSFYFGLGSVLGNGQQVISWIHVDDVIGVFLFLLHNTELTGAFNVTAPRPVSQAQFAHVLAKVMHRPLFLTTPSFVVRSLFGEMGESLLLNGQRVVPKRLLAEGYQFQYPTLITALEHEFHRKERGRNNFLF
jgi:uncharacterized protein